MGTHFPIVIPTITRSKNIFTLVSQRVYAELGGDINFPLQWANSHSPLLHNIMSWQPITPFGKWKGPAWVFSYCTTSSDNALKVAKNCVHRADEPKNLCCSGVGRQHSSRNQKKAEALWNKETVKRACQEADMDTDITVKCCLSVLAKGTEPWERGHSERSWRKEYHDTDICSSFSIM